MAWNACSAATSCAAFVSCTTTNDELVEGTFHTPELHHAAAALAFAVQPACPAHKFHSIAAL